MPTIKIHDTDGICQGIYHHRYPSRLVAQQRQQRPRIHRRAAILTAQITLGQFALAAVQIAVHNPCQAVADALEEPLLVHGMANASASRSRLVER